MELVRKTEPRVAESEFLNMIEAAAMRILYIYCHPLPESFHAAIRVQALPALAAAGHHVDLLDLYAENFDPVLSEDGRRHYHDLSRNRVGLEDYVARLTSAETLLLQFPTWCFGFRRCSRASSTV